MCVARKSTGASSTRFQVPFHLVWPPKLAKLAAFLDLLFCFAIRSREEGRILQPGMMHSALSLLFSIVHFPRFYAHHRALLFGRLKKSRQVTLYASAMEQKTKNPPHKQHNTTAAWARALCLTQDAVWCSYDNKFDILILLAGRDSPEISGCRFVGRGFTCSSRCRYGSCWGHSRTADSEVITGDTNVEEEPLAKKTRSQREVT